jgi:hypothetical protein
MYEIWQHGRYWSRQHFKCLSRALLLQHLPLCYTQLVCIYIYIYIIYREIKNNNFGQKEYASKKKFAKSGEVFCSLPIFCEGMT